MDIDIREVKRECPECGQNRERHKNRNNYYFNCRTCQKYTHITKNQYLQALPYARIRKLREERGNPPCPICGRVMGAQKKRGEKVTQWQCGSCRKVVSALNLKGVPKETIHSISKHLGSMRTSNTSGYKGVSFKRDKGKWRAQILKDGKLYFLGYYQLPEDAALAYNIKARELYGENAFQNELCPHVSVVTQGFIPPEAERGNH